MTIAFLNECGKKDKVKLRNLFMNLLENNKKILIFSLVCSVSTYGFFTANIINNYDSINVLPSGIGSTIASGRWFLFVLSQINNYLWTTNIVPYFNCLLSILMISISACLIVSYLDIKFAPFRYVVCALFVVFPSFAAIFPYVHTVQYYAFSILLSFFALILLKSPKLINVLFSGILFCLSVGIYQGYLPLIVSLMLIYLMIRIFDIEENAKETGFFAIRCAVSIVLGLVLYFVINNLFLAVSQVELTEYQGLDQMGNVFAYSLFDLMSNALKSFFNLPFSIQFGINTTRFIRVSILVIFIISTCYFIYLVSKVNISAIRKLVCILLFILFPFAANSIFIICPSANIHTLMVYALVCIFFLPIVLLEIDKRIITDSDDVSAKKWTHKINSFVSAIMCVLLSLVCLNYVWLDNGNYTAIYYENQETVSYFNRLATRIQSVPGYTTEMKVAIIGNSFSDPLHASYFDNQDPFEFVGTSADYIDNKYTRDKWFKHYLGYMLSLASEDEIALLSKTKTVQNMQVYPDDQSILVYDGYLIVKIGE